MKQTKGITLIALIITIIVLLILSAITITLLTSDDGFIEKANQAKLESEISQEKEGLRIAFTEAKMKELFEGDAIVTSEELQLSLNNNVTAETETYDYDDNQIVVTYVVSQRRYIIDQDGNIIVPGDDIIILPETPANYFTWTQTATRATVTGLSAEGIAAYTNGQLENLVIPKRYNSLPVTTIGSSAFNGCTSIDRVVIPDSVTGIGGSAFNNCTGMSYLSVPISTPLHSSQFTGCTGLTTLVLTKGTGIGYDYQTSPTTNYDNTPWYISRTNNITVTIESGVTSIGEYTFFYCVGLKQVTLPSGVDIGASAFSNCTGLTNLTIPNGTTISGAGAFKSCAGITSLSLPSTLETISNSAFQGCSRIESLQLPSNLTSIGNSAFSGCSSIGGEIIIPSTITTISQGAFNGCTSIDRVVIPDSVTGIGGSAFNNCTGMSYLSVPISTPLHSSQFTGCTGLTTLVLTKGTGIGYDYQTSPTTNYDNTPWYISRTNNITVVLEKGITKIGNYTFYAQTKATFKYTGTQEEYNLITMGTGNTPLTSATVTYNYSL